MKGNFKIIFIIVFIAAAVLGIFVFSGAIPIGSNSNTVGSGGTVTIWGTTPSMVMSPLIESFNTTNPTFTVKYVQKYPESFDQDLLEALASGTGPDLFFISNDLVYKYNNKIFTIPYTSYPLATFKSTFASAGEVFLTSKGMLAFPISIDPMVMYYNRTILNANNIIYPPATWEEVQSLVPILTKKDSTNKIVKSAVAMGQFSNIIHAKDILSTLFMQSGNSIIAEQNGSFLSTLNKSIGQNSLSLVLKFYTDFSNSLSNVYSWNKGLQKSSDAFTSENLALYFGYASELPSLINKNPNQDFLAASMPQIKNSNLKLTNAQVGGIAITSSSKNFNSAFSVASLMATSDFASKFANATSVAPARRDLLNVKLTDSFFPVFYESALFAKSWLDPSPTDTDNIFKNMIEGVLSNNMTVEQAIMDANSKLGLLLY